MIETHAYLVGIVGLAVVFGSLSMLRRDLLRVMVYSGLFYLIFMSAVFVILKLLSSDQSKAINPGYWSPPSILNLNSKSGGYGIEDAFYMFFVGAIAAGIYDILSSSHVSKRRNKKLKKGHAIAIAISVSLAFYVFTPINAVDFFIIFQFIGASLIIRQRIDLIWHSVFGGISFMLLYVGMFEIFKLLFPDFLANFYHLHNTSNIWLFNIPLEEYLYSLTLGLMWAPLYGFEHQATENSTRRRWSRPGRSYQAAAASRR